VGTRKSQKNSVRTASRGEDCLEHSAVVLPTGEERITWNIQQ
jgi:hypothetical protein